MGDERTRTLKLLDSLPSDYRLPLLLRYIGGAGLRRDREAVGDLEWFVARIDAERNEALAREDEGIDMKLEIRKTKSETNPKSEGENFKPRRLRFVSFSLRSDSLRSDLFRFSYFGFRVFHGHR